MFSSTNQPDPEKKKRGKDKRTLILDAIKEKALLDLDHNSTKEDVEMAFFGHVAQTAFNPDDSARSVCLTALLDRGWAKVKPESEKESFELESETPYEMSIEILKAASNGKISVDQGSSLINALSNVLKIKEIQEFDERLKALEKVDEQD